jgi:hypothetical protein
MLAFSYFISSLFVITPTYLFTTTTTSNYTPPKTILLHLPEKLQIYCTHCIFIYMWFYSLLHTTIYTTLYKFIQQQHRRYFYTVSSHRSSFRQKYLFLLIYILFNLSLTTAIYHDTLPTTSLFSMPTIFSLYGLYYLHTTPKSFDHHSFIHSEPTLSSTPSSSLYHSSHDLSTNSSKHAYLSAWQSTHNTTLKLMNFNPGGYPICIDTGASSCISNNKSDFINLHSTTNTVLNGIGSGLNIDGVGTLCWKFTNDNGDEISLHIQDSLYVPSAPM